MNRERRKLAKQEKSYTKQIVAAGTCLFALLFLMPLLLYGGEEPSPETPEPTGSLPLDRVVVTPGGAVDGTTTVRVSLGEGEILSLPMDKYLWRVVAAEMPASFEPEALKAQTVAARTYTLVKMEGHSANHPEADVCSDITCCQAYIDPETAADRWGGQAEAYSAKIAAAVAGTDGMTALYEGAPIQAVFFSSAAGRTVDAVEVWGNEVPYLSSVESPEGEEDVPNYHTTVTVSLEEFRNQMAEQFPQADLSGEPGGWFANTVLNSGGGVSTVEVGGVPLRGSELRGMFHLRSSNFTVSAGAEGVTFSVTGYGHGVGLSQYGANALARQGMAYQDILKWYYSGIEVGVYQRGE